MCITNFVKRNSACPVNVSVNPALALSKTPSLISQRLHGNFLPILASTPVAKPATGPAVHNSGTAAFYGSGNQHTSSGGDITKNKPKRRRKPQKPGLTAKKNERHFVKHDYHDHAFDTDESDDDEERSSGTNKPCNTSPTFPMKLHSVLERVEAEGLSHIVSWQPHGRCFCIHKPKEFVEIILPTYLRQGKLTSFQRQLNLYGYQRLTRGKDAGAYYHELFLRGKSNLTKRMRRTKIKGTKFKAASNPEQEPDFYTMPPVTAVPQVSDESSSDSDSYHNKHNSFNGTMAMHLGGMLEFNSNSRFEPIPLQVAPPRISHTPIQPYPLFSATVNNNYNASTVSTPQVASDFPSVGAPTVASAMNWGDARNTSVSSAIMGGFNTSCGSMALPISSTADRVLDDAVDELFNSADAVSDGIANLDDLWDPVGFDEAEGVGQIETDVQLGNLLESFLEQN
ncbi:HSF-type DNA-binding protein [Nitzschia inconspicua]|uniref:HSF-type DNA-binding protein n=1 Tax=Nitzschia inconspicua TaxID=303405 RepID=A0A9K3LVF4_9STRA|nr:HSF-type DNA-binding protein [Nitzschia inconspicua]